MKKDRLKTFGIAHFALCFFRLKKHVGLLFSSAFAFAALHSKFFFRKNPKKG
ncbi:MAG: hypothetical protein UC771_08195 [Faecalibacterium sp.]|nr:hypothetical protein [Faecalibacterium sp.]